MNRSYEVSIFTPDAEPRVLGIYQGRREGDAIREARRDPKAALTQREIEVGYYQTRLVNLKAGRQ